MYIWSLSMKISLDIAWQTIASWLMSFIFYKTCIASNDGGLPEALHQQLQQLSYPEDSEMGIFFALAVPLDDPVSTKSLSVAFFFEANYKLDKDEKETMDNSRVYRSIENFMSRKKLYSILESKLESFGLPGKSCILRFICETSKWSTMHYHNGLIGDLFRLIFTPSSSVDEDLPSVYIEAEHQLDTQNDCAKSYSLCPVAIYDYITSMND